MTQLPTTELLRKAGADLDQIAVLHVAEAELFADYRKAMQAANRRAQKAIGDNMLVSWYDRDRDFESPQYKNESHTDSAFPRYIDYGLSHNASLVVDIENGRFVFIYMKLDSMQV